MTRVRPPASESRRFVRRVPPSLCVLVALFFSSSATAVWPMPPYSRFPCSPGTLNCGGGNPAQWSDLTDLQTKEADRSPNSNATPNTFGECGGSLQWCTIPSFFGAITHRILPVSGAIQFDIPYDFPNAYCQNWANPDPAEWPTPTQNTTIRIYVGGTEFLRSTAVFERGHWQPTIAGIGCNASQTYSIQLWTCSTQPPYVTIVSQNYTVTTTPADCAQPQSCPTCGAACSTGPGGVGFGFDSASGFNGAPIVPVDPVAGPLGPQMTYNGNNPADGGPGQSWFAEQGQTLASPPFSTGRLAWTDGKGFVTTFTGSDGAGYSASDPGDARGTVALVSGDYVLSTPDGMRRTFAGSGHGYWKKTTDRWGNGSSGNGSTTTRATTVDELMAGATTGRQLLLSYDVSGKLLTITDVNGGVTQVGHDVSGRLTSICRPGESCATPWRRFAYDGSSSRIVTITDANNQIIRGYSYKPSKGVDTTWIGAATYASGKERTTIAATSPAITVKREKGDGTTVDTTYTVSSVTGVWRVSAISGACPECGEENSTRSFDFAGRVLTSTNGNGVVTGFAYDADGNVTQRTEASGDPLSRATSYTYAVPGTDPLPSTWPATLRDFWKTRTSPSGIKASASVVTTRSWGGTGNLELTESTSGYLSATGSAVARSTKTTYDANGRILSADGPRPLPVADVTSYEYYLTTDPLPNRNRLLRITTPEGSKTKFEYHPLGGVSRLTREKGTAPNEADAVTEYGYDAIGRRTTETIKATASSTEKDLITTYVFDTAGRLASVATNEFGSPAVAQTFFGYEAGTDRLLTRTNTTSAGGSGERITYQYDDRGNVTRETHGFFNGAGTTTEYDVLRVFDGRCRVKKQTYPVDSATTRYDYDCAGNLTGLADANHYTSDDPGISPPNLAYAYDSLNRLNTTTRTATTNGNDVTQYQYDKRDQLVNVSDPDGAATTYTVDDFGAVRQQLTPLAGGGAADETLYDYDEANNLISTTQTGVRGTSRAYDAAGRLTTISQASGPPLATITYTYDSVCLAEPVTAKTFGQGRLCKIIDGSGTTEYGYDRRGLVVRERHTRSTHVYDLTYQFDAAGRRTSILYPSGELVTTTYDLNGRPQEMRYTPSGGGPSQDFVKTIRHQINGPTRSFRTAGNLLEARTFDTRRRRLSQSTFNLGINPMTLLMGWQYGDGRVTTTAYDKESNLKAVTDVTPGVSTPNRTFGYDTDRYFLTSSTGPYAPAFASQTLTWIYDKNGNRLSEARSGIGTTTYGYKNDGSGHSDGVINTITPPGSGAITVTHSSAGDLTLDEQAVQYSYDALGRVTEGFSASGCTPSARNVLGRDALGHRVSRIVYPCNSSTVSKTEYFVYGSDGSLYFREGYNGSGGLIEREAYAFLEDEPVAVLRSFDAPTGNFFLHNDHLGRPLAMSGTDGFLKWKGEFEPFGKSLAPRVKTSGIEPGFRFPGQWEYGDSGDVQGGAAGILGRVTAMEDNWHRSYAQRWGRYTQPDPVSVGGYWSYKYALSNPLGIIDSQGLAPLPNNPEATCLICTVFAEARGLSASCQNAVASVVLNRLARCRTAGIASSVCSVVSAASSGIQFDGYGNSSYRTCEKCLGSPGFPSPSELVATLSNFSTAFPVTTDADFYGTPAVAGYFKSLGLTPVRNPSCPAFVFFKSTSGRPAYCN